MDGDRIGNENGNGNGIGNGDGEGDGQGDGDWEPERAVNNFLYYSIYVPNLVSTL